LRIVDKNAAQRAAGRASRVGFLSIRFDRPIRQRCASFSVRVEAQPRLRTVSQTVLSRTLPEMGTRHKRRGPEIWPCFSPAPDPAPAQLPGRRNL